MSEKSGLAPVICERCERVFRGGVNAWFCPACRRQIQSENARKIGLGERGREAQRNGGRIATSASPPRNDNGGEG